MGSQNIPTKAGRRELTVAGRVLLLALTIWALAMIVPGLHRVIDTLGSFGLTVDNNGIIEDVVSPFASAAESPAAEAGIAPGDRIDLKAMRCVPLGTPAMQEPGCGARRAGWHAGDAAGARNYTTIQPKDGGPPRTVTLESKPAPLTFARESCAAGRHSGRSGGDRHCVLAGLDAAGLDDLGLVLLRDMAQSGTVVHVLCAAATLADRSVRAGDRGIAGEWRGLRWPDDLCVALPRQPDRTALAKHAMGGAGDRRHHGRAYAGGLRQHVRASATEKITEISFAAGLVVDAAVLVILLLRRRTLPPHEEQRMRWVIWGCAIGLPTFILAELCQSSDLIRHVWGASPSPAFIGLLYLPNGVLAYLASQAVWQHRVVSVTIPLRHGTIITALSLAVGVPIIQLHEKLAEVPESLELPGWVWPLVVAPVVLLLMNRLHELTVEIVDRVFNRKFHLTRRQLEEASEAIVHAKTLAEIDRMLVESAVHDAVPVVGCGLS